MQIGTNTFMGPTVSKASYRHAHPAQKRGGGGNGAHTNFAPNIPIHIAAL